MCGYFCIECVDCMFKGENLTRFTSLFSPSNFENNDKVILNYFLNQNSTRMVDKKKKKKNRNVKVYPQLVNEMQFRLNKISKIKYYLLLKFAKKKQ